MRGSVWDLIAQRGWGVSSGDIYTPPGCHPAQCALWSCLAGGWVIFRDPFPPWPFWDCVGWGLEVRLWHCLTNNAGPGRGGLVLPAGLEQRHRWSPWGWRWWWWWWWSVSFLYSCLYLTFSPVCYVPLSPLWNSTYQTAPVRQVAPGRNNEV